MAQAIPLSRLAEILAKRVNISDANAQRFIQLYFETISYGLVSGGEVSIRGLGTFSCSTDTDSVVTFTPDESLAKVLNAPFEAFMPVPIPADIDMSEIDSEKSDLNKPSEGIEPSEARQVSDSVSDNIVVSNSSQNSHKVSETETAVDNITKEDIANSERVETEAKTQSKVTTKHTECGHKSNYEQSTSKCSEPDIESAPCDIYSDLSNVECNDSMHIDKAITDIADDEEDDNAEVYILPRRKCRSIIWVIFGVMAGIIGGIYIGYCFHDDIDRYLNSKPAVVEPTPKTNKPVTESADSIIVARVDSCTSGIQSAIEKKRPEPKYDIVTSHQFLTTLAKKYYGVKDYWVYIYEANKSHLRHPDRIKPGTQILIPEITEYLVDPTPTDANIRQARQLAAQIYGRFKK